MSGINPKFKIGDKVVSNISLVYYYGLKKGTILKIIDYNHVYGDRAGYKLEDDYCEIVHAPEECFELATKLHEVLK